MRYRSQAVSAVQVSEFFPGPAELRETRLGGGCTPFATLRSVPVRRPRGLTSRVRHAGWEGRANQRAASQAAGVWGSSVVSTVFRTLILAATPSSAHVNSERDIPRPSDHFCRTGSDHLARSVTPGQSGKSLPPPSVRSRSMSGHEYANAIH